MQFRLLVPLQAVFISHSQNTMPRPIQLPSKKIATREVIILAIVLSLTGFTILTLSVWLIPKEYETPRESLKEIGSVMFGLGVISLIWDLYARRAFMREVLDSVNLAQQVEEAGLQIIAANYNSDVPWDELFESSPILDIFVAYAHTWRNLNRTNLERLAKKPGACLRIVLPDPNDGPTMDELARRFTSTAGDVSSKIREAVKAYTEIRSGAVATATVTCYYVKACPLCTIYMFSSSAVVSFYSHQRKRVDVPTFMVEASKPLYNFFNAEFLALLNTARVAEDFAPSSPTPSVSHANN